MNNYSERLMIEIAHLRHLQDIGILNCRITHCLEMLRWIRIEEENIDAETQELKEIEWIKTNGNHYIEQLKNRKESRRQ